MPSLNKVILIGNLTRDPEIKYTPKGTAIAAFGLAMNRHYTTEAGEKREEVTFVDIEAYSRLAEIIGEYCRKGEPIAVEGRLKLDTWDDKETGQKRSKLKVVAESMQLLGGRRDGDDNDRGHGGQSTRGGDSRGSSGRGSSAPGYGQASRTPPPARPKPAHDPDLDAAPDDIPF